MPYVIVEGVLGARRKVEYKGESQSNRVVNNSHSSSRQAVMKHLTTQTFYTSVSGLKADEIAELKNFSPGVDKDNYTIIFPQHPCVILNALEILGFNVVSSSPKITFNDNKAVHVNEQIEEIKN